MTEQAKPLKGFRELRIAAKMTQLQVAGALGISISTVNRIETGRAKVSMDLHNKINALFGEPTMIRAAGTKIRTKPHAQSEDVKKMVTTVNEKRFLKTCWNMREALRAERMSARDLVDATFEFMECCEAITYLYKWSKIGFYHYANGGVVDQGYFLWDKLPPNFRRIVSG